MSKTFAQYGTRFRRKAELPQEDSKMDEEAWKAWAMTATGIIDIHALTSGLFTGRAGPMCSVGRNAIAVGLAEDTVLIQFGKQLHDDVDDDDAIVARRAGFPATTYTQAYWGDAEVTQHVSCCLCTLLAART